MSSGCSSNACASQQTEFVINPEKACNGDSGINVVSAMAGTPSSGIVTFNVGGTTGSTTTTTLQKYPESSLFRLALRSMGKLQPIVDEKGRFFIDRDGTLFRHVLNFMRSGSLELPAGFKDYKLLLADADYFKLSALREAVLKMRPGLDNPWSGRSIIVELVGVRFSGSGDIASPDLHTDVTLRFPSVDNASADASTLREHPTYVTLHSCLNCGPVARLHMNALLLKVGGRLLSVTATTDLVILEKWLIEL